MDQYMDPARDYIGYLLKQKVAGRIRYLGFSSHMAPEGLARFLDWYPDFDMALIKLNYLDWTLLDGKGQYDLLTKRGIPVWVMEPLKGGRLVHLNDQAEAILNQAAPGQTIPSWSFRYLLGLPNVQCVLSGMTSPEEIRQNAAVFEPENQLTEAESAAPGQSHPGIPGFLRRSLLFLPLLLHGLPGRTGHSPFNPGLQRTHCRRGTVEAFQPGPGQRPRGLPAVRRLRETLSPADPYSSGNERLCQDPAGGNLVLGRINHHCLVGPQAAVFGQRFVIVNKNFLFPAVSKKAAGEPVFSVKLAITRSFSPAACRS